MNNSHISLVALIVAVFFSGIYLRGESARKQEIKRELNLIRDQQEKIIAQVDEINRVAAERDQMLLNQIDSARTYIELLNLKDSLTTAKLTGYGENIKVLQEDINKQLTSISDEAGISTPGLAADNNTQ
jgi:hypothetical protein